MSDVVTAAADPRIEAALAPLPAGAPDPTEFRDSPAFEALDVEMRKLEREGPSAVSWSMVVRESQAALAGAGKDSTVACWLAMALGITEALPGLATGLAIVNGLVERWWETMTPLRPRARAGSFDWLGSHVGRLVPADLPDGQAAAALDAFAALDALDRGLADKMAANPVTLGDLLRPLRILATAARAEQARVEVARQAASVLPAPGPAPAPAVAAASPAVAGSAAPSPSAALAAAAVVISTERPEQAFSAVHDAVRTTALALMEANLADWRSFQLLRSVTWLAVTEPPPAQGGRTALMPPPPTRMAEFDSLAKANNQLDLVLGIERFCSASGLFWLDGQRICALALAELGPRYAPCAREVAAGTLAVLDRLPGLDALLFSDGTPFADGPTRAWLETIRPVQGGGAEPTEAAPWVAGFAEARQTAMRGEAEAALAALCDAANAAPDGRSRLFWRLAQARLCLETNLPLVGLALLRDLDGQVDKHGLEAWEPNLAAEIASLLYQCASSSAIAETIADGGKEAAKAFARAARSNPTVAARVLRAVPT